MALEFPIESILKSLDRAEEPVRVSGTFGPVNAAILTHWANKTKGPPLTVLCPNNDSAIEFALDFQNMSDVLGLDSIPILTYPTWEQSAYSSIAPSLKTRTNRLSTLSFLSKSQARGVIALSLSASCQATLPPEVFLKYRIRIYLEQEWGSRENLIKSLLDSGYLRVDPAEDPGTFAVRGDIVDVFPIDRENPVRLELFGDFIEKIRTYDQKSQRAFSESEESQNSGGGPIQELFIPPAREVLINSETYPTLRRQLKEDADNREIHRSIRDPVINSFKEGISDSFVF